MKKWRYSVWGLLGSTYSDPTFCQQDWQPRPILCLAHGPPNNQGKAWKDAHTCTSQAIGRARCRLVRSRDPTQVQPQLCTASWGHGQVLSLCGPWVLTALPALQRFTPEAVRGEPARQGQWQGPSHMGSPESFTLCRNRLQMRPSSDLRPLTSDLHVLG